VGEVNPSSGSNHEEGIRFTLAPVKREFIDTSTWEQIIRVLEETSIQAFTRAEHSGRLAMGMGELIDNAEILTIETSGLGREGIAEISNSLRQLLADVFALYLKTKNFHWHMTGRHFRDYHLLLDEHADQIFAMTDEIAERARKIGATTLHSISDIARHQRLKDNNQESVTSENMLSELRADNQQVTRFRVLLTRSVIGTMMLPPPA
jgi:DNA-binding ferritin-like protein